MFDISTVSKRYFEIKLSLTDEDDNITKSIELEVEPPKLKFLKELMAIQKTSNEDAIDDLSNAITKMLSKNKSKYKVPIEFIDDLNYDQMQEILIAYFDWLSKEKNSKN